MDDWEPCWTNPLDGHLPAQQEKFRLWNVGYSRCKNIRRHGDHFCVLMWAAFCHKKRKCLEKTSIGKERRQKMSNFVQCRRSWSCRSRQYTRIFSCSLRWKVPVVFIEISRNLPLIHGPYWNSALTVKTSHSPDLPVHHVIWISWHECFQNYEYIGKLHIFLGTFSYPFPNS